MNQSRAASQVDNARQKKSPADWARFWFAQLAKFHKVHDAQKWKFTQADVIAFLRAKLKSGVPAWKRLMIVKGLIYCRNRFLKSQQPHLEDVRSKLHEIAQNEKQSQLDEQTIRGLVGKISSNEPDIIQELKRTLRVQGKCYNTEKAYVNWIRKFMRAPNAGTILTPLGRSMCSHS